MGLLQMPAKIGPDNFQIFNPLHLVQLVYKICLCKSSVDLQRHLTRRQSRLPNGKLMEMIVPKKPAGAMATA
jgi:hypothetical protein